MGAPGYAAIGIYRPGESHPTLMSTNGKVIVFDTPSMARHAMPLLGRGRIASWSADGDTIMFSPIDPRGVNRACVLTGYDVYNLPAGLPVKSETRFMEWRQHVMWHNVFVDSGQMVKKDDQWLNTAIGELRGE